MKKSILFGTFKIQIVPVAPTWNYHLFYLLCESRFFYSHVDLSLCGPAMRSSMIVEFPLYLHELQNYNRTTVNFRNIAWVLEVELQDIFP
jgi:hypothetical protein